jgi:Rps23 Pro-64 3,4-dihydroxylase Tpa1-like proline 4-hydroxylase
MILNLNKFKESSLQVSPYKYMVIEDFINQEFINKSIEEFPEIIGRGSFPAEALTLSIFYQELLQELFSSELKELTAQKFGLDLSKTKGMLTFRGFTSKDDGKIHIDSKGKIITFLLYLNADWGQKQGGNLRILNNKHDIDDFAAEVPPKIGTLVVFECSSNAWHGHLPFAGKRQSLQFNYVKDNGYLVFEKSRHLLSAWVKKFFRS